MCSGCGSIKCGLGECRLVKGNVGVSLGGSEVEKLVNR